MGGVARFDTTRFVYLTRGTAQWLPEDFPAVLVRYIDSHTPSPSMPSPSIRFPRRTMREPVQYVFSDGDVRLGSDGPGTSRSTSWKVSDARRRDRVQPRPGLLS